MNDSDQQSAEDESRAVRARDRGLWLRGSYARLSESARVGPARKRGYRVKASDVAPAPVEPDEPERTAPADRP